MTVYKELKGIFKPKKKEVGYFTMALGEGKVVWSDVLDEKAFTQTDANCKNHSAHSHKASANPVDYLTRPDA